MIKFRLFAAMSEESQTLNIVLFGGGRWARVIAGVLCEIMSENHRIFWITQHNYDALVEWMKKKNDDRIMLLKDDISVWDKDIHASIVATAPGTHAFYAEKSISRGIDTFVEKPFVTDVQDGDRLYALSKETDCVTGVNLVFMYADYLQDFAASLAKENLKHIEVIWHDPALEVRYDEEKRPDFYTCAAHDMFPHAWSLLKVLRSDLNLQIENICYTPEKTIIAAHDQATEINISLSRRSKERVRQIKVNNGEWTLDFSKEPGFVIRNGSKIENSWKGKTPLYQSLENFLKVAQDPRHAPQWRTSLENCINSVYSADRVHASLQAAQYEYLSALEEKEEDLLNNHIDLLIDLFLPQLVSEGKRPSIITEQEKKDFAACALSLYDREDPQRRLKNNEG